VSEWAAPRRSRERILIFGPPKAGKSTCALDVVKKLKGRTAFILDCDNAWDRMLDEDDRAANVKVREEWRGDPDPDFAKFELDDEWCDESGTVVLWHVNGWLQFREAFRQAHERAERDDWIIVDSMTHPWSDIQEWYVRTVFGKDFPDYLLQQRIDQVKAGNKSGELKKGEKPEFLVEWSYLNAQWNEAFAHPFTNGRCHQLVLAEAKPIHHHDNRDTKELYLAVGRKPDTQKRLGYQAATVLSVDKEGMGDQTRYVLTTIGDRGREDHVRFDGDEWEDFFVTYMKGAAGWKLNRKKVGSE